MRLFPILRICVFLGLFRTDGLWTELHNGHPQ
jgi:hypothetical protein